MITLLRDAQNIFNIFINFVFANIFWFRFVGGALSALFLFLIIYFILILNLWGEKIEHWFDVIGADKISERKSEKAWQQIEKRLKFGGGGNLKLAILEADRILDELTKLGGFSGRTLDERLEQITSSDLSNIEDVRSVHQIRHKIIADPSFSPSQEEVESALMIYKRAFVEFGLLDD